MLTEWLHLLIYNLHSLSAELTLSPIAVDCWLVADWDFKATDSLCGRGREESKREMPLFVDFSEISLIAICNLAIFSNWKKIGTF